MKIVIIYGKPAVGKLTVARELARLTGGRLFHNHLTVNLALSLFAFGSPGFVELRESVWKAAFARALQEKLPLVLFTFNPEDSVPQRFIDDLEHDISRAGAELVPVELRASEASIEARLGTAARLHDGKTMDAATYRALRARGVFDSPQMPAPRLCIDTDMASPLEAAERIARLL